MEGERQSQGAPGQGAGQGWYEGAVNHPASPMPSQHHQVRHKTTSQFHISHLICLSTPPILFLLLSAS